MDDVARQPASERAELFTEAGARRGLTPTILEKDFWVCWILKRLFSLPGENPLLVFKGGTSLSKVYGAIRRFSEDIDLSFDRKDLGYLGERDPESAPSGKKREQLITDLVAAVEKHIGNVFLPRLNEVIQAQLGRPGVDFDWVLGLDPTAAQVVIFRYPAPLSRGQYGAATYINPIVRLELGARGDAWPTERHSIWSYAAEVFPGEFKEPAAEVTVLAAERTFWEKATLLHMEYHRAVKKSPSARLSRHYYDLALLADTEYGRRALTQLDLLERVAKHKRVYFPAGWAKYEEARPGSLRLVPPRERLGSLAADYAKMAPMIFDQRPPRFEDLIARIDTLESHINAST